MKILWIDDAKQPNFYGGKIPELETCELLVICRTYDAAIRALFDFSGGEECLMWDRVYIDHDLGEEKTGYDIMCTLEMVEEEFGKGKVLTRMSELHVISNNSVGAEKMIKLGVKLLGPKRVFRTSLL